jgi:uncharacterized sulfatase
VVVITSDHGEEFMEHGSVKHTQTVYEEMIRVPLIIRVPGKGASEITSTVRHVDVVPTVLELLGIESRGRFQGSSLVPLMEEKSGEESWVYAETVLPGRTERYCVIKEGLKFIRSSTDPSLRYPAPADRELFELYDDPAESRSILEDRGRAGKEFDTLMKRLKNEFRKVRHEMKIDDESGRTISSELKEVLEQQGYL